MQLGYMGCIENTEVTELCICLSSQRDTEDTELRPDTDNPQSISPKELAQKGQSGNMAVWPRKGIDIG